MNDNLARLAHAGAFLVVTDRETARHRTAGPAIRTVLHETQTGYFDTWLADDLGLPVLAFGRVFYRQPSGERVLGALPMALCRDVAEFRRFLKAHHAEACRDPLERVAATGFVVVIADKTKASVVRAMIAELDARDAK